MLQDLTGPEVTPDEVERNTMVKRASLTALTVRSGDGGNGLRCEGNGFYPAQAVDSTQRPPRLSYPA
jgi:hypothetical protein